MTAQDVIGEELQKAVDSLGLVVSDLQHAHATSTGLATLALARVLRQTVNLRAELFELRGAIAEGGNLAAACQVAANQEHSPTCGANNFRVGSEEREEACNCFVGMAKRERRCNHDSRNPTD